jgi:adenylosuccinate lyase
LSEGLGIEKRWIHYGLTSTDIVDTGNALILKQANAHILEALNELIEVIKELALTHQNTLCMGRTHGMHAELTSFGYKFALFYDEMMRAKERFNEARRGIEQGKISGAVGTALYTGVDLQDLVCAKLGIQAAPLSTQVLSRDLHAHYIHALALMATSCEKIVLEIRHLQRSEIREVEEGFSSTQKGSSAMPQKRNPIGSENITGLARLMRSYVQAAYENVALWHERDISHSSVERVILPDACTLSYVILTRLSKLLKNLNIYPEHMLANIELSHNTIYAQNLIHHLIDKAELSREEVYDHVQKMTRQAIENKIDFKTLVTSDAWISQHLSNTEILSIFDPSFYLKEMKALYQRVGLY